MAERSGVGVYSIEIVGIGLSGLSVSYLIVTGQRDVLGVAKIAFPFLLGLLVVGYGIWLRHRGVEKSSLEIVAVSHVVGGATFTVFTGWLLYVASIEFRIPPNTAFVLLNGIAIGVVLGGLFGTLYVNLVRNQELIRRRNRELKRQNDRLDQFASIVSHDLRNPLNVAKGRVDLARESSNDVHFDALELALDRMDAIISDMLAFARQGKTVENPEPVALSTVAESAWEGVDTGDLELVIDGEFEVEAVPGRLRQAFENLYRNTREHGGNEVTTVWVGPLTDSVGFYVEDDGSGIPPGDRDQIFDSGFSTTRDGTGFGLPIVRAVVQAHGWTIDVTGGRSGGARFEIRTEDDGITR
ncbi:MAG: sensor histidine kinase [Halodesulfurarchaeum sp.]